ncbi:hypothetical protein HMPREF1210_00201 [Paenisporosarcina sp. HGH0030]|uniref:hypothetical protein n=1 Tax=Paenisporosarcina sp. HGH0030 TaxID=1078085 RepID=UPI00034E2D04|nr:hypothetical protein [Paenisporosarcina sp. HGH0030]EPD54216.1 hypothetical protein HMPREF1210_00201 [Paenisporosarcina sp. HGH0030]
MGYSKKTWVKIEGCDCFKCREAESKEKCEKNHDWDKKNECKCAKCGDVNIHVVCKEEDHDKKDHDEKKKDDCEKCTGKTDKVEFQSDKSFLDDEIFEEPIQVLQVSFNKICEGDKVWLSGIVGFDNDTDVCGNDVAVIKLTIVRTTASGSERTIYRQTFEIDQPGHDDLTQVPFAHVEFESNENKNVTYTVFVQRLNENRDVFLFGQNTLAALRIN